MRIAFFVLGLLGFIHASPLNYDSGIEEFGKFIEPKPEIIPSFDEEENARVTAPPSPSPPETTRPPQVHHNTALSQGPFSGRLVNVLLNEKGAQETIQKNRIAFNIEGVKKIFSDDIENSNE